MGALAYFSPTLLLSLTLPLRNYILAINTVKMVCVYEVKLWKTFFFLPLPFSHKTIRWNFRFVFWAAYEKLYLLVFF